MCSPFLRIILFTRIAFLVLLWLLLLLFGAHISGSTTILPLSKVSLFNGFNMWKSKQQQSKRMMGRFFFIQNWCNLLRFASVTENHAKYALTFLRNRRRMCVYTFKCLEYMVFCLNLLFPFQSNENDIFLWRSSSPFPLLLLYSLQSACLTMHKVKHVCMWALWFFFSHVMCSR